MAMWRSFAMMRVLLLGGLFDGDRERLGAGPAMLGDVEQDALGPIELLFEITGLIAAMPLVDVVLGAEAIEPLRKFVDILDQDAEMMDAAEIHALAELVGLEFEDRHVERAVGKEHAIGEHAVGPADLDEIERLFVELGHRFRVLGGDCDVAELGHQGLLAFEMDIFSTTGGSIRSALLRGAQNRPEQDGEALADAAQR